MSPNVDNIGSPQGVALQAIQAQQVRARTVAPIPAQERQSEAVRSTDLTSSRAVQQFSMAARVAAEEVPANDPMKPVADGIAEDLSRVGNDPFEAVGKINDLQNAFNFAMEANANLLEDPALAALA
ncbi:MAG: hypothetical protein H8E27_01995 [Verrucomicrobia subdivision 3 bacterium]|nr:hypothetical protein [Limisphaerales bacterium]